MKALKIETNGKIELIEITGDTVDEQNDCIWGILGGYFDIVHLPQSAALLVNDEGLLMVLPINLMAMAISGYPILAGTALIVGVEETEDGGVFTDCPAYYASFAEKKNA
ncbi:MAG: DUF3846 domain-containing protein [Oscillospiraceae bacterium]|nr:DUF3846 domain-containing protein [Oscillospiraceae bacterium]MBR1898423.1 DUF3846 domain-containing protein [Oscillospiraceae bacterium]